MNIVAHLDTNLMMPEDVENLTPASIKSRIHGSKLVLVVEQSMIVTIWGCKFCLLLSRLFSDLDLPILANYSSSLLVLYLSRSFGGYNQDSKLVEPRSALSSVYKS